jgi:hypothetical protein
LVSFATAVIAPEDLSGPAAASCARYSIVEYWSCYQPGQQRERSAADR